MNEQTPDRRWQLQEAEGRGKQWNLLDSEQELDDRWHLQPDEEYTSYEGSSWRPIDDLPEERSGGAGWVLPSLVLVAVLAVAGYVAIVGFDRVGLSNLNLGALFSPATQVGSASATATPSGEGGEPQVTQEPAAGTGSVVDGQPTPTALAPTPTLEPATSTPAPTVEKRTATVREQYGVNARSNPSTVGDPIEVVPQGSALPIWDEQKNDEGDWYYVTLPNNTKAWVSAQFVDITSQPVSYDEMNSLRQAQGLPLLPTPTSEAAIEAVAPTAPAPTPAAPQTSDGAQVPVSVSATISSPFGLNLRSEPNAGSNAITLLADSLTFPVVGRNEDGSWLQLQLADQTLGWVVSEFLRVSADISQLPVGGISQPAESSAPAVTAPAATAPLANTPIASTTELTATTPTTATAGVSTTTSTSATTGITASVVSLSGSRVRTIAQKEGTDITVLNFGDVVNVLGRSEDGLYLKVELQDGQQGWLLSETVEVSVPSDTLPVIAES